MSDATDLREVFDRAASLPPQERAAFLAQACDGNDGLRREVERLLAADARLGVRVRHSAGERSGDGIDRDHRDVPATRHTPRSLRDRRRPRRRRYGARSTKLATLASIARSRSKFYRHELTADPSTRQRFDREARAIAALSHPAYLRAATTSATRTASTSW